MKKFPEEFVVCKRNKAGEWSRMNIGVFPTQEAAENEVTNRSRYLWQDGEEAVVFRATYTPVSSFTCTSKLNKKEL